MEVRSRSVSRSRSRQFAHRGKRLGSSSEVDGFRVERRQRSFIVRLASGKTETHLGNQRGVGLTTVGRADPHVGAALQPVSRQIVRARGDSGRPPPPLPVSSGSLGGAPGRPAAGAAWYRIADQVHHPLLQVEGVDDPADVPGAILHADQDDAAGEYWRTRRSYAESGRAKWGEVALEFQLLPLGLAENLEAQAFADAHGAGARAFQIEADGLT